MRNRKAFFLILIGLSLGLLVFGPIIFYKQSDFISKWIGQELPEGTLSLSPEKKLPAKVFLKSEKNIFSFWAQWCDPCVMEMPRINAHADELGQGGITLNLINLDQGMPEKIYANIQAWLISQRLNLKTLFDFNGDYMDSLELPSLPVHIGVDANAKVLWIQEGEISWDLADIKLRF